MEDWRELEAELHDELQARRAEVVDLHFAISALEAKLHLCRSLRDAALGHVREQREQVDPPADSDHPPGHLFLVEGDGAGPSRVLLDPGTVEESPPATTVRRQTRADEVREALRRIGSAVSTETVHRFMQLVDGVEYTPKQISDTLSGLERAGAVVRTPTQEWALTEGADQE